MSRRPRCLVIGFTPFEGQPVNPSQLVVEELTRGGRLPKEVDVVTEVLDTAYGTAGDRVRELIVDLEPSAVLLLGVAATRSAITIERFALNLDEAPTRDNAGELRSGRAIVPDGPAAYTSTLPIDLLIARLQAAALSAAPSNHAGTFVCNHVFYSARHALARRGLEIPCGFVHLPAPAEFARDGLREAEDEALPPSLPELVRAIELVVATLAELITRLPNRAAAGRGP